MSVLLNFGAASPQAASSSPRTAAKLKRQIVVNQQRRKKSREIGDRITEGPPRDLVAIGEVDPQRIRDEDAAENNGESKIDRAAHADYVGKQAGAKQDQGIEQHLQARVL